MKRQMSMTVKRTSLALSLAVVIAVPAVVTRAQANRHRTAEDTPAQSLEDRSGGESLERLTEVQSRQLEGSWVLTVTPVVPPGVPPVPPFRTYMTVSRGGGLVASARNRPFGNPQHGTWAHTEDHEYATTQIQDLFDGQGVFQGTFKVRQKITMIGQDEFVGVASAETRDAAGNIVTSGCATTRGERITIEPLAPQCQSIEPPY